MTVSCRIERTRVDEDLSVTEIRKIEGVRLYDACLKLTGIRNSGR